MGCSALLAELGEAPAGGPPPVDLDAEVAHGQFVRAHHALIAACTDLSDGGLALAAFELAHAGRTGVDLDESALPALFGEDQARYLIACAPEDLAALEQAATEARVSLTRIGRFGGDSLRFGGSTAPMAELAALFTTGFEAAVFGAA